MHQKNLIKPPGGLCAGRTASSGLCPERVFVFYSLSSTLAWSYPTDNDWDYFIPQMDEFLQPIQSSITTAHSNHL
jgi:hypothetical protein